MILNVGLYHDSSFLCYERGIATIALWLKRKFEMMFLDVWDFRLVRAVNGGSGMIGDLICPGEWNIEQYIERFHSIRMFRCNYQSELELRHVVLSQIQEQIPLMVDEDWLVYGINDVSGYVSLYCIHSSEPMAISWEQFVNGINGKGIREYFTFKLCNDEISLIEPAFVIQHTRERLLRYNQSLQNDIKEFAEIFYTTFDFDEIKSCVDIYEAPLVKNVLDVSRGRKLFRMALQYVDAMNSTDTFRHISTVLESTENKWLFIMSLFVKSYYAQSFDDNMRIKIYKHLKELIPEEKIVWDYFIHQ